MLAPKQIGLVSPINDLATGGVIALAVGLRIEQHRALLVDQTTAGQALTLPAPVDDSVVMALQVSNIGSAAFTMYGVTLSVASSATFYWNGTAWTADVAPTSVGAVVEALTPTAENAVPALASAPKTGTPVKFFVNGSYVTAGITSDAGGAITVDAAALGYNVDSVDTVTAEYYV